MPRFDAAVGRYVYLDFDGVEHRVYFEEAGEGVPILLQHTAGADGRQWRHVLEDPELQSRYRLIAYDLPYHGKSVPPTGKAWWSEPYRLTKDFLMSVPVGLADALDLADPLYMGSSIGGHLAVTLRSTTPSDSAPRSASRHPRTPRAASSTSSITRRSATTSRPTSCTG